MADDDIMINFGFDAKPKPKPVDATVALTQSEGTNSRSK